MKNKWDELLPTRRSLLERVANDQNQEGWYEFYETYWRVIYTVALKAGLTDAEAEDVVQETMVAVAKRIQGFKYDPARVSFKTWLLTVTRWTISEQFRMRRRRAETTREAAAEEGTVAEGVADVASDPFAAVWEEEWEKSVVAGALLRLSKCVSASNYQIFFLRVIKQYPVKQVAAMTGVSMPRVYLAVHRLTPIFKRELEAVKTGL